MCIDGGKHRKLQDPSGIESKHEKEISIRKKIGAYSWNLNILW